MRRGTVAEYRNPGCRGRLVDGPGDDDDGGRGGHVPGDDDGGRGRVLNGRPVATAVTRQTSLNRIESVNSNDDDDDINNNYDNDDSDSSLESVDLTSHDNDDDNGGDAKETVRTVEEALHSDQSALGQRSQRISHPEPVDMNKNGASVGGEDIPCTVSEGDVFLPDAQNHQPGLSFSNKICGSSNPGGNIEIGSAVVARVTGDDGFLSPESGIRCQFHPLCDATNESNSNGNRTSVFDDLLFDIYDRWHAGWRDSFDSDTFTDLTESDVPAVGRSDWNPSETDSDKRRLNLSVLKTKDVCELEQMISDIFHRIGQTSSHLVKQLKCRERRLAALREKCDIVTAILHASSLKRRIDSKIRFSLEPLPGDDAFGQWKDAMKAVARLPLGIPSEFRKNVWLALADNYLSGLCIDWEKTKRLAFNEKSNPDDSKLGLQIVKDLHRTGCSGFNGQDNEEDRAVLKRVLLAYARWNKSVGYCQGFNILAALILDVVDRKEDCALKVMIYLVDHVLPESYFANNLRALSVDMAVFRDLLHAHLLQLSRHLDHLQNVARDQTSGASYEPPLTNVFTMQWFLTLFATCLPKAIALRVWDSILLEGSEILLRTAIAIWGTLESHILNISSADEFYSSMGVLSQEMLDGKIVNTDKLIKVIYSMAPFPFPQLAELREKYTYNITPFTASLNPGQHQQPATDGSGAGVIFADDEDLDEDELIQNINCFAGLFLPPNLSPSANMSNDSESSSDISKASPGAYAITPVDIAIGLPAYADRVTLDLNMLRKQYKRLKQRQKQAHIILAAANARQKQSQANRTGGQNPRTLPTITGLSGSPTAVNHLFMSRQMMNSRGRSADGSPRGSAPVGGCDDFRGRASLSIPQRASKLTRNNQNVTDGHPSSLKLLHGPLGKALVENLSSGARSRSDSLASVNGSENGSVGCDSNSCSSLQSGRSGSSVSGEEMPKPQISVDPSGSCARVACETPNGAVFESPSELDKTLHPRPVDNAVTLTTSSETDGNDHMTAHRYKFSADGQNSLPFNTSKSDKRISNSQTQNLETQLQGLKVTQHPVTTIDSSEIFRKSLFSKTRPCIGDAVEGCHQNGVLKDCSELSVDQNTRAPAGQKENSASETVVGVFNPFPKQLMHPRKTRSNIRMRLYSEVDAVAIGGGQVKRSSEQLQRTAYLQRQYAMQMTRQSKVNKS